MDSDFSAEERRLSAFLEIGSASRTKTLWLCAWCESLLVSCESSVAMELGVDPPQLLHDVVLLAAESSPTKTKIQKREHTH